MLVVCQSDRACEPPERDCGTWVRGRPAWPWNEWDWLGQRIHHADTQQPAPARPGAGALKVARQPQDGCWLWQGATADLPDADAIRLCGRLCVRPDHLARHAEDQQHAC